MNHEFWLNLDIVRLPPYVFFFSDEISVIPDRSLSDTVLCPRPVNQKAARAQKSGTTIDKWLIVKDVKSASRWKR